MHNCCPTSHHVKVNEYQNAFIFLLPIHFRLCKLRREQVIGSWCLCYRSLRVLDGDALYRLKQYIQTRQNSTLHKYSNWSQTYPFQPPAAWEERGNHTDLWSPEASKGGKAWVGRSLQPPAASWVSASEGKRDVDARDPPFLSFPSAHVRLPLSFPDPLAQSIDLFILSVCLI